MNLHLHKEAFDDLVILTTAFIGIPETAVRRDYFIVLMLQNLGKSPYADPFHWMARKAYSRHSGSF